MPLLHATSSALRRSANTLLCALLPAMAEASYTPETPRLANPPEGDFTAALREFTGGPWMMDQAWRTAPQEGFLRGSVRFGWTPEALWVLADLPDDHVTTGSTDHSQRMWELGDVFEIFLARPWSPFYLELHVTPKNHRLHLRWTNRDLQRLRYKKVQIEQFIASPGAFASWVRRTPDHRGWQVLVRLPAALWPDSRPFSAGQKLRASFSRYDAGPSGTKPVLSSTSPHRKLSYHRRHEWRTLTLCQGSGNL